VPFKKILQKSALHWVPAPSVMKEETIDRFLRRKNNQMMNPLYQVEEVVPQDQDLFCRTAAKK